jgi:hypothetical protein
MAGQRAHDGQSLRRHLQSVLAKHVSPVDGVVDLHICMLCKIRRRVKPGTDSSSHDHHNFT